MLVFLFVRLLPTIMCHPDFVPLGQHKILHAKCKFFRFGHRPPVPVPFNVILSTTRLCQKMPSPIGRHSCHHPNQKMPSKHFYCNCKKNSIFYAVKQYQMHIHSFIHIPNGFILMQICWMAFFYCFFHSVCKCSCCCFLLFLCRLHHLPLSTSAIIKFIHSGNSSLFPPFPFTKSKMTSFAANAKLFFCFSWNSSARTFIPWVISPRLHLCVTLPPPKFLCF